MEGSLDVDTDSVQPLLGIESGSGILNGKPSISRQFLVAIISCLAAVSMGFMLAYSSPTVTDLQDAGLLSNNEQVSWFGSIPTLGAILGGPIAGVLLEKLGRKSTVMLTAVPFALGYELLVYSPSFAVLLIGRALTGVGAGMSTACVPLFIGETSTKDFRGTLGAGFQLSVTIGVLLVDALGMLLQWRWLAVVGVSISSLMVLAMLLLPESPRWLLKQDMREEARQALSWLRGPNVDINEELNQLELGLSLQDESQASLGLSDLKDPIVYKPVLILVGLMFFQQFSGINAVIFYGTQIFESAGFKNNPKLPNLIIGLVQVVATFVSCILMDKAGRKILLLIALTFMTISSGTLGLYYYLTIHKLATGISWLSLCSAIIYIVVFSLGLGPIPWLLIGEIFPNKAKGFGSGVCTVVNWTLAFVITKEFAFFTETLTEYGCFWMFGSFCLIGVVYVIVLVPETKGKSLDEISEGFRSRSDNLIVNT